MGSKAAAPRFLVGLDGAGTARQALARAFDLARRTGGSVDVLHASELLPPRRGAAEPPPVDATGQASAPLRQALAAEVAAARDAAGLANRGTEVELDFRPGRAAAALLAHAEQRQIDWIVLGPQREHGRFDFGSTTRAVLAGARVPVWNQLTEVAPVGRILVPVDFSDHSRRALAVARELARILGAELELLHCYQPPWFGYGPEEDGVPGPTYTVDADREAEREELERWLAEVEVQPARAQFTEGDPRTVIPEAAQAHDLIVMGSLGRTGLSRFLLGSVAYRVLESAVRPLVVVPAVEGP
jgi:nucleotide-binding universal stress UspA family protein